MTATQRFIILHMQHGARLFQRYSKTRPTRFIKRIYLLTKSGNEVNIPMRVFHQLGNYGIIRSGRDKGMLGKEFLLTPTGKAISLGGSPIP